ncbi:hypothetical protein BDZ91DRAFT_759964 [Kalaharituber pfeilii]|nr:hypothetical protein BDZ91DRAFT_759964 [Kalaharituber pfeilii]
MPGDGYWGEGVHVSRRAATVNDVEVAAGRVTSSSCLAEGRVWISSWAIDRLTRVLRDKGITLGVVWVKGHTGIDGNERADGEERQQTPGGGIPINREVGRKGPKRPTCFMTGMRIMEKPTQAGCQEDGCSLCGKTRETAVTG